MFGYVLPIAGELKVREYRRFQSAYCGLCHAMGRRSGPMARFMLNYDFTFLAMLLDGGCPSGEDGELRCMASPVVKRRVCGPAPAFEMAADDSVILTYWKIRDNVSDGGFFARMAARFLSALVLPLYRKAAGRRPAFDRAARSCLNELQELEQGNSPSLDRTADTFARILQAAGEGAENPENRRAVEQILYHVGRWIYLADAYDDLEEDFRRGRYNPVAARFALKGPVLEAENRSALETTMRHSLNLAGSAYQLADFGRWSEIIGNILYLGLPAAGNRVLEGLRVKPEKPPRRPRFAAGVK